MILRRPSWCSLVLTILLLGTRAGHAQHEEKVAPMLDAFWNRQVRVVQPRAVQKDGSVELVGLIGVIPNGGFMIYMPLGVRAAYHLTESWGLEASFEYNLQFDSDLRSQLEESNSKLRVSVRDRQQLRASVGVTWNPIYGKMALGGSVVHFDGFFTGGAGIVQTEAEDSIDLPGATRPDFYLGLGLRVFVNTRFLFRLEYRQYLFLRPHDRAGGGGGVALPSEIALCGGVLLGGNR